jgi:signal transduction histidine kinase
VTSLTLGGSADLAQLGAVLDRLPVGVLIFEKTSKDVIYANAAARRLLRPATVRVRAPLPEPWHKFSLRKYAETLVVPGVAPGGRVGVDDDHTYQISGSTARGTNSGVILIEDVSGEERRSRAEREFVANAAHELLTPLTGIVGATHVLQAGAKEVPEERDRFIQHIAHECSRLARIARSLLVLARAQSGEEPPRLEIVPVHELLGEAVGQVDVPITLRCDEDVTVLADADLFVQAAVALLVNAARHGSEHGITVRVSEVGSNLVEIDVVGSVARGDGAGAFRGRFRSAAGRDGGGFGLGLSIAQQSLDVMGGRLLLHPEGARIQLPRGGVS